MDGINCIDVHVGARLRQRREALYLSRAELASRLDVSPLRIQAYEDGSVRIVAAALLPVARAVDAPIGFFFSGFSPSDHTPTIDSAPVVATP